MVSATVSLASPAVSALPFYAGVDNGFFRAHGVDLQIQQMAGSIGVAALAKGDIQFMSSPSDSINGAANGFPFKIVYSAWDASPWALIGKQEIADLAATRGKSIAVNRPGTAPYAYLEAGLKQAGLAISDVNLLFVNGTEPGYSVLMAGQVDAAVVSPPFDIQAEQSGMHTIASLGQYLQVPYIGLATSADYIRDHRAVVVNAIKGMLEAEQWIRANPDGSAALISKYIHVSPEVAMRAYQKMIPLLTKTGETRPEGVAQQIALIKQVVKTPVTLEPAQLVDFSLLQAARAN